MYVWREGESELGEEGVREGGLSTLSKNMPHAPIELRACAGFSQGYRRGLCGGEERAVAGATAHVQQGIHCCSVQ